MNIFRTAIFALIALAMTPIALAEVYKCDGPDGPIYSDRECESGASIVELSDTSGLSGVDDKTKTNLAEKN
jgi:hypothetical protein